MRFGKSIRIAASLAFSVQTVLRTALVLYAASLALNAVAGVSQTACMAAVGVLCTFYSTIGGIKAVIVTDTFQVSSRASTVSFRLFFCAVIAVPVIAKKNMKKNPRKIDQKKKTKFAIKILRY